MDQDLNLPKPAAEDSITVDDLLSRNKQILDLIKYSFRYDENTGVVALDHPRYLNFTKEVSFINAFYTILDRDTDSLLPGSTQNKQISPEEKTINFNKLKIPIERVLTLTTTALPFKDEQEFIDVIEQMVNLSITAPNSEGIQVLRKKWYIQSKLKENIASEEL